MRNPIDALKERFGRGPEQTATEAPLEVEFTGAPPSPPDPLQVDPHATYLRSEELGTDPHDGFPRMEEPSFRIGDLSSEPTVDAKPEEPRHDPTPETLEEPTAGDLLLQSIATEFILICSSPDCDGTCLHNSSPDGKWRAIFHATTEEELDVFAGGPQVQCQKCKGWQARKDCELYAT